MYDHNELVGLLKVCRNRIKKLPAADVDAMGYNLKVRYSWLAKEVEAFLKDSKPFEDDPSERFDKLETEYKEKYDGDAAADDPSDQEPEQPKKKRGGKREGAGRKGKGYEKRVVTLRLPPEYWECFDQMTKDYKIDSAGLVRRMMMSFVDHMNEQASGPFGYDKQFNEFEYVICPVCEGIGQICPKGEDEKCPGCGGLGRLEQVKISIE